ncbi:MAG: hypothetical protein EOP53_02275 [Sphingobacteriales bacterium]|nr:MAG: hypothetical protein EOP53_02275 [Sphingobacteriales bacterium]
MEQKEKHLQDITEIRQLMERSSRFLSLSGFSGILVGIFALIGAAAAYWYLDMDFNLARYYDYTRDANGQVNRDFYTFFFTDALLVLAASLGVAYYYSSKNARRRGTTIWDGPAKRLIINLMLPLIAGGFFCLILLYHGLVGLVAPVTLLFYGLALLNASKYTYDDIRALGLCEMALGLLAAFYLGYGLLFWAIGFGVLHIIYGVLLYRKYER